MIGEHINGPTPELTAQDANEYAVAFQRDKAGFAPQSVLCSSAWVWTGYLESAIKKIAAGNWSADTAGGLPGIKEGGTDIVCCNAVLPKDVVADITATRAAIIGGKEVFAGPLQDNTGNERVASGQTLSDADLNKMDWYVDGVTAQK